MRLFTNQKGGRWWWQSWFVLRAPHLGQRFPLRWTRCFTSRGSWRRWRMEVGQLRRNTALFWTGSIQFHETWLLFVEYVHDWGWDELHDRVHDALFLLLVATAGRHRLLWTGEAALGGLLHRGRRLRFLLLFLLDAVLHGQMKGWRRGSGCCYSLGDAQRGTWRQTRVFQHLVSDAGLPFCYLWLCFNKIDTSGLYVKWLQCTEGSTDGVMVDLEAEMWKMSWTPAWPLCCPPGHTIMWFWTYKGLKGGLPLSGSTLCRKKNTLCSSSRRLSKDDPFIPQL